MDGRETKQRHEDLYQKTIDQFVRNVEQGRFTPEAVPNLVQGLRAELGQCIEIGLIGSPFYAERMEVLGRVLDTIEV